jgi:hypothetical protein
MNQVTLLFVDYTCHNSSCLGCLMGTDPIPTLSQRAMLPLHYRHHCLVGWVGIEPTCRSHGVTARCPTIRASNPLFVFTTIKILAGMLGFEPSLVESKSTVLADTPHPNSHLNCVICTICYAQRNVRPALPSVYIVTQA